MDYLFIIVKLIMVLCEKHYVMSREWSRKEDDEPRADLSLGLSVEFHLSQTFVE